MSNQEPVRRKHGFEPPYSPEQMATWVLFPLVLTQFFAFLMPLLASDETLYVVLPSVFGAFGLLALYGVHQTCSIDAADPNLILAEDAAPHADPGGDPLKHCYRCRRDVVKTSMHCVFCNKCVLRFDHHCKWLNTCVGQANYRSFLLSVLGIAVITTLSLGLTIVFFVESLGDEEGRIAARLFASTVPLDVATVQWVAGISLLLLLPLVAMVWQLALFHAMLLRRGLTTYDYIIGENKRQADVKREKAKKAGERQRERSAAADVAAERANIRAAVEKSKRQPVGSSPAAAAAAEEGEASGVEMRGGAGGFSLVRGDDVDVEMAAAAAAGGETDASASAALRKPQHVHTVDASQLTLVPLSAPAYAANANAAAAAAAVAVVDSAAAAAESDAV